MAAPPLQAQHPQLGLLKLLHVAGGCSVLVFGLAFLVLGMPAPALVEASYGLFTFATLFWLAYTGRGFEAVVRLHVVLVVIVVSLVTLSLGGLVSSGIFIAWGLIGPAAAMMFLGRRAVVLATALYLLMLFAAAPLTLAPVPFWVQPPSPALLPALAAANIAGASLLVLATLAYFVRRMREEQQRADSLLLNILPADIAAALKLRPGTIAQEHEGASILFADIVDFTVLCGQLSAGEIVDLLNSVFSHFDELAARYGMEKIKTIGDAYMVVAGVPHSDSDHAQNAARLALDMRQAVTEHSFAGQRIDIRVGINSGPLIAGVIGRRKFIYDVWGRAVNLASRMETSGEAGCIQVTRATWELLDERFLCRPAGIKVLKGCGAVEVWFVVGLKTEDEESITDLGEKEAAPGA